MIRPDDNTPLQENSALGVYWKILRRAADLSQEELVARLRAKGLLISAKQIWGWEKGRHTPASVNKAKTDEVLHGNPALSDALLLYDQEQAPRFNELARQAADASLPEDMRAQARAELQERAQKARDYGTAVAEAWLEERELQALAAGHAAIPALTTVEVQAVATSLYTRDPDFLNDWLRFGWYLTTSDEQH
jgi:transcriptional regulator with XRE-family HTH domain